MAIYLDAHVHYHPCFEAAGFLEAAWRNLHPLMAARSEDAEGCLCLTEGARERAFERLGGASAKELADWELRVTGDGRSLTARRGSATLLIVAGRQIVTREGLEVLAVGGVPAIPDGELTRNVIAAARAAGAVPVLPWGFGKWTLGRGELVRALIAESRSPELFVGDNGGRAAAFPASGLLQKAAARGVWTVSGSDPLPFASQQKRVGSYGSVLPGRLDPARPAVALVGRLRDLREQPVTFGRLERLAGFIRMQVRMQWRKRWGRQSA